MPSVFNPADAAAYCLSAAAIAALGLAAPRLLRLRDPRARGAVWALTFFAAFGLPLLPSIPNAPSDAAAFHISTEVVATVLPAGRNWLPLLWLSGAVALAGWRALGLLKLWRWHRRAKEVQPAEAAELGIGQYARIFCAPQLPGPLVFGRGTVLLPDDFASLPSGERRAVLAHELIHVARQDGLRTLAWEVLRIPLWFHPAAHLLLGRLTQAREQIVDQEAARLIGDRRSYAEALVRSASRGSRRPLALAPLFSTRRRIVDRLRAFVEDRPMPDRKRRRFIAVAGLGLAAFAVAADRSFVSAGFAQQPEEEKKAAALTSPPRLIEKVEPVYTEEARQANVRGTVVIEGEVRPDGRFHSARITKSLGYGLDESALEAVRQWRFKPGEKDGEPTVVRATIEVNLRPH